MLGIKIFARGWISTVWPVPHYAGAILVAQKRNNTKLISCLPRDVYCIPTNFPKNTWGGTAVFGTEDKCNFTVGPRCNSDSLSRVTNITYIHYIMDKRYFNTSDSETGSPNTFFWYSITLNWKNIKNSSFHKGRGDVPSSFRQRSLL